MIQTLLESPVGLLTLVSNGRALVGVTFPDHSPAPKHTGDPGSDAVLEHATAELREWFAGQRQSFSVPVERAGTPFQMAIWEQLDAIGWGETRTYGELAHAIGRPKASRAVGAAVGRNPLSIVVPCHRVLGASGRITGFAGGVDRKRWLLAHEAPSLFTART